MAKFNVTTKPLAEVTQQGPTLPKATVSTDIVELDGVQGIQVTTFYPLPEDNEVEVTERKGRKTDKVDNSDKVASVLTIIGRAAKVDLVYTPEGATEEVALVDGGGNQIQFSGKIFTRAKGEVAESEEDED